MASPAISKKNKRAIEEWQEQKQKYEEGTWAGGTKPVKEEPAGKTAPAENKEDLVNMARIKENLPIITSEQMAVTPEKKLQQFKEEQAQISAQEAFTKSQEPEQKSLNVGRNLEAEQKVANVAENALKYGSGGVLAPISGEFGDWVANIGSSLSEGAKQHTLLSSAVEAIPGLGKLNRKYLGMGTPVVKVDTTVEAIKAETKDAVYNAELVKLGQKNKKEVLMNIQESKRLIDEMEQKIIGLVSASSELKKDPLEIELIEQEILAARREIWAAEMELAGVL